MYTTRVFHPIPERKIIKRPGNIKPSGQIINFKFKIFENLSERNIFNMSPKHLIIGKSHFWYQLLFSSRQV